jgi:YebC/PmpR family DNA-binding regulatory protein
MAGHSKWNNIKHGKGAADAKRSKAFTQISKLIKSAVKEGGSGDPDANPYLRPILEKARAANMPKEKVSKAIDRGLGKTASGVVFQEILYEGFGPAGIACMVQAVTDNPNRTGGDIRHIFSKHGGSLGGPNSASYMFQRTADGIGYEPTMPMPVDDPEQLKQLQTMVDLLREYDDVEDVYVATDLGEDGEDEDA